MLCCFLSKRLLIFSDQDIPREFLCGWDWGYSNQQGDHYVKKKVGGYELETEKGRHGRPGIAGDAKPGLRQASGEHVSTEVGQQGHGTEKELQRTLASCLSLFPQVTVHVLQ